MVLITTPDALKSFFLTHLPPIDVPDRKGAVDQPNVEQVWGGRMEEAAAAWLQLTGELHQDGYYRFTRIATSAAIRLAGSLLAFAGGSLQVLPTCGNKGTLTVRLRFGGEGCRLQEIEETLDLQPGIRPKDQARKLLDPDPAVRKKAEDDLRLMGPEAFDYLMRERIAAPPELQALIDKLWIDVGKVPAAARD